MKSAGTRQDLIVAIDIGTTKICVLVAQALGGDMLEVLGIGNYPSHGLAKGVVVDIGKTVQSIKNAVREAEIMAGCSISNAYIGISGAHIQSRTSQGMVPVKRREISAADIQHVLQSASAVDVAEGQQILHVLPQFFVIDSKERVLDPLGMYGVRLEAQVHIITGAVASLHNLVKCCQMAGINVVDVVLEQLASANAVLTDDERQLGVAMLDIGGGTSDLAIYHNGSIRHTMVLPIAGNHFTNDVAIGLQTTLKEAERVKRDYGFAHQESVYQEQYLDLLMMDGVKKQQASQLDLATILHARAEEIFYFINQEIETYDMRPFIPAGLVLTGGGSLLGGIDLVASSIMRLPIRLGQPLLEDGVLPTLRNPMYATAYGLLLHGMKKHESVLMYNPHQPIMHKLVHIMKSWVSDFF